MDVSPHSDASPLSERFSLDDIISGLANDMEALRAGRLSVDAARAQAELAKQLLNGVRLVVNAQKYLEGRALPIEGPTE
jgi:hypothetical protein